MSVEFLGNHAALVKHARDDDVVGIVDVKREQMPRGYCHVNYTTSKEWGSAFRSGARHLLVLTECMVTEMSVVLCSHEMTRDGE